MCIRDRPKGIYGLLGENGAGKTTLIRVLTTVLKQTEGMVSIDGILYNEMCIRDSDQLIPEIRTYLDSGIQ